MYFVFIAKLHIIEVKFKIKSTKFFIYLKLHNIWFLPQINFASYKFELNIKIKNQTIRLYI